MLLVRFEVSPLVPFYFSRQKIFVPFFVYFLHWPVSDLEAVRANSSTLQLFAPYFSEILLRYGALFEEAQFRNFSARVESCKWPV